MAHKGVDGPGAAATAEWSYEFEMTSFSRAAAAALLVATPALAQDTSPKQSSAIMEPPPAHISPRGRVGMVVGGSALVVTGLATAGGGALLTWFALNSHACAACPNCGCDPPPYALLGFAIPIDLLALASVVGGVIMIALGAKHVPTETVSFNPSGLRVVW